MSRGIKVWMVQLVFGLAGFVLMSAVAAERPVMRVAPCRVPPEINGEIKTDEWQDANMNAGFISSGGVLVPRKGWFWFTYDKENVYIAIRTEAPPEGNLVAKKTHRDDIVCYDDAIEIWLNPNLAKGGRYYQLLVNSIGTLYDKAFDTARPDRLEWTCNARVGNRVTPEFWEIELAIPFADLGVTCPEDGTTWAINVGRDWQRPGMVFSDWSGSVNYVDVNQMGKVVFDKTAPVIQVVSLGKPHDEQIDCQLKIRGNASRALNLAVKLEFIKDKQQAAVREEKVSLNGNEVKELSMGQPFIFGKEHQLLFQVKSADDAGTVYYERALRFVPEKKPFWVKAEEAKVEPLVCRFYPSRNSVLAEANLSVLKDPKAISKVDLKVFSRSGNASLAKAEIIKFCDNHGDGLISLPPLNEGTYYVQAQFIADQGKVIAAVTNEFVKKAWPWEGNKLGISDEVIPPFTALEVKGKVVEAVLRKHFMNDFGFWDQVESKGKKLLARPMSLECRKDGAIVPWNKGNCRFVEKHPSKVVMKSEWANASLKGTAQSTFDYDGFMKVELEIAPMEDGEIDGLSLVIPLRPEMAKLYHAVSDTGGGPAAMIPSAMGVVLGSRDLEHRLIETSFIPYIWVGEEERGLCWMADTDRDWILKEGTSAIEIERTPEEVILKVNLVSGKAKLARPRKFVFGLQATPVKPMPPDWRKWFYSYGSPSTNARAVTVFGYIGGDQWSPYPWGDDYALIKAQTDARKTGRIDEKAVAAWKEKWLKTMPDKDRPSEIQGWTKYKYIESGIDADLRSAAGLARFEKSNMMAYNNCCYIPGIEERKYYAAEWADGVNFSPVPSYRDFAVWYFAKMMDLGYDGMYLDVTYPYTVADWVVGEAWRDDEGKVHAACRGFAMREYVKRLAVMMYQKKKDYVLMVHTTGAMVIPTFSFCNMIITWEMRYGVQDYQDRFPLDFIRAESIGRQCGAVPVVLGGILTDNKEEMKRLTRTFLAVMLPHELRAWIARTDAEEFSKAQKVLLDFGAYTATDDEFVPYWSNASLARDGRVISYYKKGGKLLVIVTNMGDKRVFEIPAGDIGITRITKAMDAQLDQPVPIKNDCISVEIPRHDYRLLLVE